MGFDRVAICGPMYSGKTTLAHELKKHDYLHVNFTDTLKHEVMIGLRAMGIYTTVERMKLNKKRYRGVLQEMGVILDFDTDPKWVIEALGPWFDKGQEPRVVFDNVRTYEQYMTLKQYGFELVELQIGHNEQVRRAMNLGVTPTELEKASDHPIERGIERLRELEPMRLDATRSPETNVRYLLGDIPHLEETKRMSIVEPAVVLQTAPTTQFV